MKSAGDPANPALHIHSHAEFSVLPPHLSNKASGKSYFSKARELVKRWPKATKNRPNGGRIEA